MTSTTTSTTSTSQFEKTRSYSCFKHNGQELGYPRLLPRYLEYAGKFSSTLELSELSKKIDSFLESKTSTHLMYVKFIPAECKWNVFAIHPQSTLWTRFNIHVYRDNKVIGHDNTFVVHMDNQERNRELFHSMRSECEKIIGNSSASASASASFQYPLMTRHCSPSLDAESDVESDAESDVEPDAESDVEPDAESDIKSHKTMSSILLSEISSQLTTDIVFEVDLCDEINLTVDIITRLVKSFDPANLDLMTSIVRVLMNVVTCEKTITEVFRMQAALALCPLVRAMATNTTNPCPQYMDELSTILQNYLDLYAKSWLSQKQEQDEDEEEVEVEVEQDEEEVEVEQYEEEVEVEQYEEEVEVEQDEEKYRSRHEFKLEPQLEPQLVQEFEQNDIDRNIVLNMEGKIVYGYVLEQLVV